MGGLTTRSGAITLGLDDLVDLAWRGSFRVPRLQHDFRWSRQDVIRLFDSVVKHYPIGSLLLWRRPAPRQRVVLGAIEVDAPAVDDATWVIDGEQRITSLANVLRPGGQRDPRFALGYDLPHGKIVELASTGDSQVIPLSVVFDLADVPTWFAERPAAAEHRESVFDLAKYLHEVRIPAYQVAQDDVQVLQGVFDRMKQLWNSVEPRGGILTAGAGLRTGPTRRRQSRPGCRG